MTLKWEIHYQFNEYFKNECEPGIKTGLGDNLNLNLYPLILHEMIQVFNAWHGFAFLPAHIHKFYCKRDTHFVP